MITTQKGKNITRQRTMWEDWKNTMLFYRYDPNNLIEVSNDATTFNLSIMSGSSMLPADVIGISEIKLREALDIMDRLYVVYDDDNKSYTVEHRLYNIVRKEVVRFEDFTNLPPSDTHCALMYDPVEADMFWLAVSHPAVLAAKNNAIKHLPKQSVTDFGIATFIQLNAAFYRYSRDRLSLPFKHVSPSSFERKDVSRRVDKSCYLSACLGGIVPTGITVIKVDEAYESTVQNAWVDDTGTLVILPQHGAEAFIIDAFEKAQLILD